MFSSSAVRLGSIKVELSSLFKNGGRNMFILSYSLNTVRLYFEHLSIGVYVY